MGSNAVGGTNGVVMATWTSQPSAIPADQESFTDDELRQRHAYLLRFRRKALTAIVALAEEKLTALGRDPQAWRVLSVFNGGVGWTFDVGDARGQLGPDLTIANGVPHYSEAWVAAEAASIANAALAAIELDDRAAKLDERAGRHENALRGDVRALRAVADEARARRAQHSAASANGGRAGEGQCKQDHRELVCRIVGQLPRRCASDTTAATNAVRDELLGGDWDQHGPGLAIVDVSDDVAGDVVFEYDDGRSASYDRAALRAAVTWALKHRRK